MTFSGNVSLFEAETIGNDEALSWIFFIQLQNVPIELSIQILDMSGGGKCSYRLIAADWNLIIEVNFLLNESKKTRWPSWWLGFLVGYITTIKPRPQRIN